MEPYVTLLAALGGILAGMGGVGAYVRARGSNRADSIKSLSEAEATFRQAQAERIARLELRLDQQDTRNDSLETENRKLTNRVSELEAENRALQRSIGELSEQYREAIQRIAVLTERLDAAEKARATAVQQAQVAIAKAEILERENTNLRTQITVHTETAAEVGRLQSENDALRKENDRIKRLLPERTTKET